MEKSMRLDNTHTMHQIVEEELQETVNNITQVDPSELVQTYTWKPDKDNKLVQHFISRMRDRHTCEVADAKWLIKKSLTPEPYLYEPDEHFEYIVINYCDKKSISKKRDFMEFPDVIKKFNKKIDISYYLKSVVSLCTCFINYDDRYQPSPESIGKLKDGKDFENRVKMT